jgi:hypothetical protein
MKKVLFAAACLSIFSTACEPDDPILPDAVRFSLAATSVSNLGRASSPEVDAKIKFYNLENKVINIKWQRYDVVVPADWQVATCDNNQCWVPAIAEQLMTIPANDSFDMKLVVYPNGVVGTGTAKFRMYDPTDSARTVQSVLYTIETN